MKRRAFLGWLSTLASQFLVACQTVPITGRSQLQLLPEAEEMRMGLQAYQEILRKSRVSRDPAPNDLVTRCL
jgi:predicted Zn-dependent protease